MYYMDSIITSLQSLESGSRNSQPSKGANAEKWRIVGRLCCLTDTARKLDRGTESGHFCGCKWMHLIGRRLC